MNQHQWNSDLITKCMRFISKSLFNKRPNFDPERFKKPEPYYGVLHDKYLIANDADTLSKHKNKINNLGKVIQTEKEHQSSILKNSARR
jgi:hypothetical protein